MAIKFQRQPVFFPTGGGGGQTTQAYFAFPSRVRNAETAIGSYSISYQYRDEHVLNLAVHTSVATIEGKTVIVNVDYALRDDDLEELTTGSVDVLVIADLADLADTLPLLIALPVRVVRHRKFLFLDADEKYV
jgi:hypothetical protein